MFIILLLSEVDTDIQAVLNWNFTCGMCWWHDTSHNGSLAYCDFLQMWSGPDYPMCTVCTCTWGSTTLEAPPPAVVKVQN